MKSRRKTMAKYVAVLPALLLMLSGCGEYAGKEEFPKEKGTSMPAVSQESEELQEPEVSEESAESDMTEFLEEELTQEEPEQRWQDAWEPMLYMEMVENKWDWWEVDGYPEPMGECSYPKIRINGDGYDVVGRVVEDWFEENGQKCEDIVRELDEQLYADANDGMPYKISVFLDAVCTRMDSSIVSFQLHYSGTLTETERESYSFGGNFRVDDGQMLELSDILTDEKGFKVKAKEYLLWYLQEYYTGRLYLNYEEYIENYCFNGGSPEWCLDAEGIRFMFPPRILAADAVGEIEVTIPYQEVAEYMEKACCGFYGAGIAVVPVEVDIPVCLSEETALKDIIRICQGDLEDENDEPEFGEPVHFEINGRMFEAEDRIDDVMSCYLIRRPNGRTYFLFDTEEQEGVWETYLYELTDNEVHRASEPGNGRITAANADSVQLMSKLDVLGSYWPKVWYSIEGTGEFVQREFIYVTEQYDFNYLTVTRELPVYVFDLPMTLPEGTRLWITATDNDGTAWFRTFPISQEAKNVMGEIRYIWDDGIYIDGISEFEYFGYIPYSG